MSSDGVAVTRLTTSVGVEYYPIVNRAGTEIAFFRQFPSGGGTSGIYTIKVDGTGEHLARALSNSGTLTYNPTGTKLAFINQDSGVGPTNEIFTMNRDGTALAQFTAGAIANPQGLSWSRDGTLLAFVRFNPTPHVFTVPTAGGSASQVAQGEDPVFAPTVDLLLYRRNLSGQTRCYVIPSNGGVEQQVLSAPGITRAIFGPAGSLIYSAAAPKSQIYRVSSGGQTTNLSSNAYADSYPTATGQ
jgi:Tol biopolymer transport system component